MKTIVLTLVFSLTVAAPLLADDTNVLNNDQSRISYSLGMMLGQRWRIQGVSNLNYELVARGLKDALNGSNTLITVQEMRDTLRNYERDLTQKREQKRKELAARNLKAADAFLAANKKKKGVKTMPDGLQYKVIAQGSGATPSANDTVIVSYEGTLLDGTEFDKSDHATFQLNGILPGWREALTHMKVGSRWQLFIPPHLAYGAYGRPPRIDPNSALIFKLHLLSIKHPEPVTSDIIKVPSAEEIKKGAKVEIIKPDEVKKAEEQSSTPAK